MLMLLMNDLVAFFEHFAKFSMMMTWMMVIAKSCQTSVERVDCPTMTWHSVASIIVMLMMLMLLMLVLRMMMMMIVVMMMISVASVVSAPSWTHTGSSCHMGV